MRPTGALRQFGLAVLPRLMEANRADLSFGSIHLRLGTHPRIDEFVSDVDRVKRGGSHSNAARAGTAYALSRVAPLPTYTKRR
jgi:hypothetical protein